MIKLNNVVKKYKDQTAVNSITAAFPRGEITMLIGPSGCGKTTTLRMINRMIPATSGEILIKGEPVENIDPVKLRRKIGYVIQEVGLFPHMNIFDNIAAVPRLLKWDEAEIAEKVPELLELVTLNDSYAKKYPRQLSGGERQRVGLARALAADPEILLMDEPFGAIDPINRAKLHEAFFEIQEQIKKTVVFVTHDINEAIKLGDRLIVLRRGVIEQIGSVEDVLYDPANEFVENLLGHDRSIKALNLKKIKELVSLKGYEIAEQGFDTAKMLRKFKTKKYVKRIVFVLDDKKRITDFYTYEKPKDISEGKFEQQPIPGSIEKNSSLKEAVSVLFESGENTLPVTTAGGKLVGVVSLNAILKSIKAR